MITNESLLHSFELMKSITQTNHQTIELSFLPHYEPLGLFCSYLQPLYCGATGYYMSPPAFTEQPGQWIEYMSKFKATHSWVTNSALELLLRNSYMYSQDINLTSVDCITNTQPVHPNTIDRFETEFAMFGLRKKPIQATYCLFDGSVCVCGVRDGRIINDRISYGVPSVTDVRVVDPSTRTEVKEGDTGEVWVTRSPSMPLGYWKDTVNTQRTFEATLDNDSAIMYIRTGTCLFSARLHNNYNSSS